MRISIWNRSAWKYCKSSSQKFQLHYEDTHSCTGKEKLLHDNIEFFDLFRNFCNQFRNFCNRFRFFAINFVIFAINFVFLQSFSSLLQPISFFLQSISFAILFWFAIFARIHHYRGLSETIQNLGLKLVYLPPYSPIFKSNREYFLRLEEEGNCFQLSKRSPTSRKNKNNILYFGTI